MTFRQLGALGIKLLGLQYAIRTLPTAAAFLFQLNALRVADMAGVDRTAILASGIVTVVGVVVAASVCLFNGDALARWLFRADTIALGDLSRRDVIFAGVALIAASMAISGIPGLVRLTAEGIWYAEASRQPYFWEAVQKSSANIVDSVVLIVVGAGVAMSAPRIAPFLDSR